MRILKRRILISTLVITGLIIGCTSPNRTERRQPNAVNFETLSLCARVRAMYVAKSDYNDAYVRQAIIDAKAVANASEVMAAEASVSVTDANGAQISGPCRATGIVDLIKKPPRCDRWGGPYLSEALITTYGSMSDEEFRSFVTCWTY